MYDNAHDAAFDKEVIKKARQQGNWDNSFVTKFGIVSEEESKALTCAFIDHIRERLEIESNE